MARYFNTVHAWLQVISQDRYYRRLPSFFDGGNPGFSVLTLSVVLINLVAQTSGNSLYLSIKSMIGVLEGMGIDSLDLLQARLLVTVFEAGHGYLRLETSPLGRQPELQRRIDLA